MKRSENRKEQTVGLQKAALQKIDSAMVGPQKTHEQLVDELTTIMTEATGTQHSDVADRIINQVINAQVCPRPRDGDHLTKAISMIREMAPQNVTEAMLAVQMIATNDAALMFLGRATTEGASRATRGGQSDSRTSAAPLEYRGSGHRLPAPRIRRRPALPGE
jgi:hypothetical protein